MVPSVDDTMDNPRIPAIPWHVPWVPMIYSMDVHHGSNHEVVHGPWSTMDGTMDGAMDGAMVEL